MSKFLSHISNLNLTRLFATLVNPDRRMTAAEKRLAEHLMHESGATIDPPPDAK